MTLPAPADFYDDALRLAVLLLGRRGEPTEAEVILIEEALAAQWRAGWLAHAASLPRRR